MSWTNEWEHNYVIACADLIMECQVQKKNEKKPRWHGHLVSALEYIYVKSLKTDSGWFQPRWEEKCRQDGTDSGYRHIDRSVFFRKQFFEPFLVKNLVGHKVELVDDFETAFEFWKADMGKKEEKDREPFHSAKYVYKRALYNALESLGVERKAKDNIGRTEDAWDKIHGELRGFGKDEGQNLVHSAEGGGRGDRNKPKPPVYPLDERMVAAAAAKCCKGGPVQVKLF